MPKDYKKVWDDYDKRQTERAKRDEVFRRFRELEALNQKGLAPKKDSQKELQNLLDRLNCKYICIDRNTVL